MSAAGPAGVRAWLGVAGLLGAAALAMWWLPAQGLDWQPALAFSEPWRAFSAAGVHWSGMHLGANLVGLALVAALGVVGRLPAAAAGAWMAAWPATHFGLLLRPELAHYGGLSGVLHAGAAIAGCWMLGDASPRRPVAAVLLAGLAAKILWERPWGPTLTHPAGWDIAVAPLAHATGALAGTLAAAVGLLLAARTGR